MADPKSVLSELQELLASVFGSKPKEKKFPMAPILTQEQVEARNRDIVNRVYGEEEAAGKNVVMPSHSTMPGYPRTFMPAPDGSPAGFSPDGNTYTSPAVVGEIPPEVGSPEWSNQYGDFLWSQYNFKKSRGEKLPPIEDYIKDGIIEKVLAHKQGYRVPTKRKK